MAFAWGKIIDRFDYDFDGVKMDIVKYHANIYVNGFHARGEFEDGITYYCEEINQSSDNLFALVIAFITDKQLGKNQGSLVVGICKSLDIKVEK